MPVGIRLKSVPERPFAASRPADTASQIAAEPLAFQRQSISLNWAGEAGRQFMLSFHTEFPYVPVHGQWV